MGGLTGMANRLFGTRSPAIPLRTMETDGKRRERDRAWIGYVAVLKERDDHRDAQAIMLKLREIWREEWEEGSRTAHLQLPEAPPIDIPVVGLPARDWVAGEYTVPKPSTRERRIADLKDQLNVLQATGVLHGWDVDNGGHPSMYSDSLRWTIRDMPSGPRSTRTRYLSTGSLIEHIDAWIANTRKAHL